MRIGVVSWGIFCVVFLAVLSARGETITLEAAADTSIFELNPDYNMGGQDDLPSGRLGALASFLGSRVLLRFDLAGNLPSNAVISYASLTLQVTRIPDGGGENSTFGLHRMLRPWGEGTKLGGRPGGAIAEAGEATWNAAFHPADRWSAPGGVAGVDFAEEVSSSERVQEDGDYQFEFGVAQAGELMEWLQNPETNFGWMLISLSEDVNLTARRFGSRENPDPSYRPRLVIQYTVPVETGPLITGIEVRPDGAVAVTFGAEEGVGYRLESKMEVAGAWEAATEVVTSGSAGSMTLVDIGAEGDVRFYRVAVE